jgi:hypothetical protein
MKMPRVKDGYVLDRGKEISYAGGARYSVYINGSYTGDVRAARGLLPFRNACGKWPKPCGKYWSLEVVEESP